MDQTKQNSKHASTQTTLNRPPKSLSSVKLGYHYLVSYLMPVIVASLFVLLVSRHSTLALDYLQKLWNNLLTTEVHTVLLGSTLSMLFLILYLWTRPRPIYLLNFSCCKPNDAPMYSREFFVQRAIALRYFNSESIEFQKKILERSGIGNSTYFPKAVAQLPPTLDITSARKEAEMVMFGAVDDLLTKTNIKAQDIGILVVNCSLFCPTPSLSEIIINRYGLKEDAMSFNLSGMGCSAGLISIDLAKQLLKVHRNSYALVVSTETLTLNGYQGNNRAMLVTNCLFRVGGAAVLLSNRRRDCKRAKYCLVELIRTHKGNNDESYTCVAQEEDEAGKVGITLSKDLMNVAGEALKANITTLGPRVLPISEQLLFLAALIGRKILKRKIGPYVPDFRLAFEHFCIHAGGRALLDAIEKNLNLNAWYMEPSRMTLYRFGNTSSSSLCYELAYSEAKGRIKKGDRVWQLAFGSGFKCNSIVWKALRKIDPTEDKRPWSEEIHELPVPVPKVMPISV